MKNESVLLELHRATQAVFQRLAAELAELDLKASEINVLGNLADDVARSVSELGTAVGAKPATLTGILDRLERRGLVARAARPGDRRAVLISLTDDGAVAASLIGMTLRAQEKRALAGVPPDAIDAARVVLRALAAAGR